MSFLVALFRKCILLYQTHNYGADMTHDFLLCLLKTFLQRKTYTCQMVLLRNIPIPYLKILYVFVWSGLVEKIFSWTSYSEYGNLVLGYTSCKFIAFRCLYLYPSLFIFTITYNFYTFEWRLSSTVCVS